jgi:DNA-binding SARP family transcriptional activator
VIGIRVLGPLEVTVDGLTVGVGGPRQRCVLARLAAARGQVVSADRLIEDLYADEAPPRALAALQSYVSHLRRALEPGRIAWERTGVLIASPPGYALRLAAGTVDAWEFEDEVHGAAALADPSVVHARLSAGLASWHGTAYQEFGGMPWADAESSRLEELRLTAVEARAGAALRLGRAAELVADLDRLVAEHPLREETWRLLALALYQSGRQGDALGALRRARALLADELGVDPGPALRELESDILAQAVDLAAGRRDAGRLDAAHLDAGRLDAGVAVAPGTASANALLADDRPPRDSPLPAPPSYVGRDAELALVLAAAAEAGAGRMRVVLVAGDAGAGKSTLADWASQRLVADGWTVAAGRSPEHDGAPAGWAWAAALRQLARTAEPADPQALAALLTDSAAFDADVAAARFRLHQAVDRYLETVSRRTPLLVVLEDLHRADSATLALLAEVAVNLAASSILVLATYRPDEAGEHLTACLAALAASAPVRVTLHGLDPAAAGELIRATCGRTVTDETVRLIAERTGGNPFYIKETARLLDSEGVQAAVTGVAPGIREVLQRRIGRLPATAQTVLRVAAVIGTQADTDVLSDMAGVEEPVLLDAIDAGLVAGLITEPAAGRVRFTHALVRDTLYHGLSRLRRARLHARAAAAIERHQPGAVAALAYHFAEAGTEPAKAARYCALAAEQAEQRFAYQEATRLWEQAIACLDIAAQDQASGQASGQAPGQVDRERLELVLSLVCALAYAGDLVRARSYRHAAIAAATPLRDPVLLARVIMSFDAFRVWNTHAYEAFDDELTVTVEQTLARLPPGDNPLRCGLLTTLANELEGAESERGYLASAEAVSMARRLGDPGLLTMAIVGRFYQTFRGDGQAERLDLGAELLALPGKPVTAEALARLLLMQACAGAADFRAGDLHATELGRIVDRYGLRAIQPAISMYRALRTAVDGELDEADELYRRAGAELDQLGLWGQEGISVALTGQFCLRIMQGRVADMASEIDLVKDQIPMTPVGAHAFGYVYAAAGRMAEARGVAIPWPKLRRDIFWQFGMTLRGLLAIELGDREVAESTYKALLPFAARPVGAGCTIVPLWPTALALGDLARYLGIPGAQEHYRRTLVIAERAQAVPWREAAQRRLREF